MQDTLDGTFRLDAHRKRKAVITGVTGQDGSYLAEFLLSKGYDVYGVVRRSSVPKLDRIEHIVDDIKLCQADLIDQSSLIRLINEIKPDEIYNLAAQSFVPTSWDEPELTANSTGLGVLRTLEAVRSCSSRPKFYQASSSEMFGKVVETPQNEKTPLYPRSPYGVAKVYGHWITINYRESYDMFAVSGILFNHESPRRGIEFVTRKITNAVAKIKLGKQDKLYLGNLDSKRDWGFAGDYVKAMWLMMQQSDPDDYVVATGEPKSVREFVDIAFSHVGLDYQNYVEIDPKFFRPAEVNILCGDSSKARNILGWEPEISFDSLVQMMVDNDMKIESK